MSRKGRPETADIELPPLYAMVHSGLEPVAADEITRDLGGLVRKTTRGNVVFRVDHLTPDVLKLRTTEDVFLLAWGSDSLTFKPQDLENIRDWTIKKPDWRQLLKLHQQIRPKPKGRPTFNLICQMEGEHGYRRTDARATFIEAMGSAIPNTFRFSNENAWLEIWLTIRGKTAVCGVRLTDRTMRHRTYKRDHIAASLRPTVAGAMARLAGIGPGMTLLDPMCGAGTILAELMEQVERRKGGDIQVIGGDIDANAVFVTSQNLDKLGRVDIARWDATRLPLPSESVDRIICNPPFGVQMSSPEEIEPLYAAATREWNRVLKPDGRAVFIVTENDLLRELLQQMNWSPNRQLKVKLLGQSTVISVWRKPA